MIVAIDASILIFLFERDAKAPIDEGTGEPLERCYDRVNHLVAELQASSAKVVIPTPALAEILVNAGDAGPEWLRIIEKTPRFMVAQFDKLAAAEHAASMLDRPRPIPQGKRKAKFDDQILLSPEWQVLTSYILMTVTFGKMLGWGSESFEAATCLCHPRIHREHYFSDTFCTIRRLL